MLCLGATVWYFTGSEHAFVWALLSAPLIVLLLTRLEGVPPHGTDGGASTGP